MAVDYFEPRYATDQDNTDKTYGQYNTTIDYYTRSFPLTKFVGSWYYQNGSMYSNSLFSQIGVTSLSRSGTGKYTITLSRTHGKRVQVHMTGIRYGSGTDSKQSDYSFTHLEEGKGYSHSVGQYQGYVYIRVFDNNSDVDRDMGQLHIVGFA